MRTDPLETRNARCLVCPAEIQHQPRPGRPRDTCSARCARIWTKASLRKRCRDCGSRMLVQPREKLAGLCERCIERQVSAIRRVVLEEAAAVCERLALVHSPEDGYVMQAAEAIRKLKEHPP